jgi:6-phosphogluconate dehydrogenase
MGQGLAERLRKAGHEVIGYDKNASVSQVASIAEMVAALPAPRTVWLMVPAGAITESTLEEVAALLGAGDTIIDGGNSYYKDSIRRSESVSGRGIRYLDCGTSGGIWGLKNGFCIMVGGPKEAFDAAEPIFAALAPKDGYAYIGPSGAGHFVKMVHNGIEYGMLEAYAEGFDLLQAATEFGIDSTRVAKLWNQGSVIQSWLLELAGRALERDPQLAQLKGYVDDSGEGRWTVLEGVDRGVNVGVLAQSLFARFTSREENPYAMRMIAALRNEFGGHPVKRE